MNNIPPRAWLHEEKTMVEVSRYDYEYGHIQWATSKQSPDYTVYLSDCTILWATGLKDKNGVMIYEGDILPITHGGLTKNLVVLYDRGCFWLCTNTDPASWIWSLGEPLYRNDLAVGEVIGNRYENPELLEGT